MLCFSGVSQARFSPQGFLDPLFERLSLSELQSHSTGRESPNQIVLDLFLIEAAQIEQKIHLAHRYAKRALRRCEVSEVRSALAALSCAIVFAERGKSRWAFVPGFQNRHFKRALGFLTLARRFDPNQQDWLYARGRVYSQLPAYYEKSLGRALLAFQMLRRLAPNRTSIEYWIGRLYYESGNEAQAKTHFEAALAKSDPRAKQVFPSGAFRRRPVALSSLDFGFRPALFVRPGQGFGLQFRLFDDRLWDTQRSGSLTALGTTEERFGGALHYQDGALFSNALLGVEATYERGPELFFGLGIDSGATTVSTLTQQRLGLGIHFTQPFWDYFYLRVGWFLEDVALKKTEGSFFSTQVVPHPNGAKATGAQVELAYDNRDSIVAPRRGHRLRIGMRASAPDLGADVDFKMGYGHWESHFQLHRRHHVHFRGGTVSATGSVPIGMYPALGGSVGFPGVRHRRFQEKSVLGGAVEYGWQVFDTARLIGFAMSGTVHERWSELFSNGFRSGFGGAVELDRVRVELGRFGGETLVMVHTRLGRIRSAK